MHRNVGWAPSHVPCDPPRDHRGRCQDGPISCLPSRPGPRSHGAVTAQWGRSAGIRYTRKAYSIRPRRRRSARAQVQPRRTQEARAHACRLGRDPPMPYTGTRFSLGGRERRPSEEGLAPARCVSPVDETRPGLDPFYGACHIHRDTPEADRGSRTSDRVGLNPFYGACYIHRDTPEAERGSTTSDAEEPHSSSGLSP